MPTFDEKLQLSSTSGAQLNVYHTAATGVAHGIVHVNHGLAEHALRYARFARALGDAGYHVYAHDHRGHGYTKSKEAPQGIFCLDGNGTDKIFADCSSVQAYAKNSHPDLPLVMFGHSMGGLITMNFALRHRDQLDGAAVWNANFDGGVLGRIAQVILKFERFRLGSDVPSQMLPKLTFATWAKQIKDRRTEFDWLSHIDSEVDAYIADPLCGWDASVGMWLDIFAMVFAGGSVKRRASALRDLPFHLIGGGEDPATNKGKAVLAQARRLTGSKITNSSTIYPNARHETLNDQDSDRATADFIRFADLCCDVLR